MFYFLIVSIKIITIYAVLNLLRVIYNTFFLLNPVLLKCTSITLPVQDTLLTMTCLISEAVK